MKYCGTHKHIAGCRPSRPLCKLMRCVKPNQRQCSCPAYPFPHRTGSGPCGKPEAMWAELDKPRRAGAW